MVNRLLIVRSSSTHIFLTKNLKKKNDEFRFPFDVGIQLYTHTNTHSKYISILQFVFENDFFIRHKRRNNDTETWKPYTNGINCSYLCIVKVKSNERKITKSLLDRNQMKIKNGRHVEITIKLFQLVSNLVDHVLLLCSNNVT